MSVAALLASVAESCGAVRTTLALARQQQIGTCVAQVRNRPPCRNLGGAPALAFAEQSHPGSAKRNGKISVPEFMEQLDRMFESRPQGSQVQWALKHVKDGQVGAHPHFLPTLAQKVLEKSRDAGAQLDTVHYNTFLGLLAKQGKNMKKAVGALWHMAQDRVHPDLVTYNTILSMCTTAGNLDYLLHTLKAMKRSGVRGDVVTLNTLLRFWVARGDIQRLKDTWVEYTQELGIQPDLVSYCLLGDLMARTGGLKGAFAAIDAMVAAGLNPTTETFNTLIRPLRDAGNVEGVRALMRTMYTRDRDAQPDVVTYTLCMQALMEAGRHGDALGVLYEMRMMGVPAERSIYHALLKGACRDGNGEAAEGIIQHMARDGHMPDPIMCARLLRLYRDLGDAESMQRVTALVDVSSVRMVDLQRMAKAFLLVQDRESARLAIDLARHMRFRPSRNLRGDIVLDFLLNDAVTDAVDIYIDYTQYGRVFLSESSLAAMWAACHTPALRNNLRDAIAENQASLTRIPHADQRCSVCSHLVTDYGGRDCVDCGAVHCHVCRTALCSHPPGLMCRKCSRARFGPA